MTLDTPWTASIDAEHPLPEYPRPQLVRGGELNLNGPWQWAVSSTDSQDPLTVADPLHAPEFDGGTIVVPYSPEFPLSGVDHTITPQEVLWYRRSFVLPTIDAPGPHRVLLHFGAVDQTCRVAVNGVEVGGHTGGFLPFTLDITQACAGHQEHEITVAVRDVTDASWLSRGKQATERGGIWYTQQSGIWQTAWLEVVPQVAVDRLVLTPRLEESALTVEIGSDHAPAGESARVTVSSQGRVVGTGHVAVNEPVTLAFDEPVRPWSPEDPFLYDVEVVLGEDRVSSYVGMRSFGVGTNALGHPCLLLNGQPYLPVGLLDQGYWPDSGLTPPSDEAIVFDIELCKQMGFTMLRKHIKVEPLRWYAHCDRIGMLVWQDHVSGGTTYDYDQLGPEVEDGHLDDTQYAKFSRADRDGREVSEVELHTMIEHLRGVPSLSLWVPFNEAWGQFDAARIAGEVAALDPTRQVDHASGWHDQGAGDLLSRHIYDQPVVVRPEWQADPRVIALTEYGGYSLAVDGHIWGEKPFGYRQYETPEELLAAFTALHHDELEPAVREGLAATVYTQVSDVEDEVNGLVTYDRKVVKFPVKAVKAINDRLRAVFNGEEPAAD